MSVAQRVREKARHLTLSMMGAFTAPQNRRFLRPLYFHGVPEDHAQNFASMIERLGRHGSFVDTDTCLSMLGGRTPIQGRYFHLSFDDGRRDFIHHAAPILKRLSVPAMIFVSTSRVGADEGVLSWDDLRQLQSWGFEIGSHTRTHAKLGDLADPVRLEEEIAGSKRDLEEKLGSECRYIAWPYGRKCDIREAALAAIVKAGYHGCFGGFRGSVKAGKTNPFSIPRHHLEADWPWQHVRYFAYGYWEK